MAQMPLKFTVYHIASTMEAKRFAWAHHARAHLAKLEVAYPGQYAVADTEHYRDNIVHMVTRKNLMTGKEYQEPSNTPNYCSPASEAYWSM